MLEVCRAQVMKKLPQSTWRSQDGSTSNTGIAYEWLQHQCLTSLISIVNAGTEKQRVDFKVTTSVGQMDLGDKYKAASLCHWYILEALTETWLHAFVPLAVA